MLEELVKDARKIEMGIKNLRQSIHFVVNNYDYHHANDEHNILASKKEMLTYVEGSCLELKQSLEKMQDLLETAKKQTDFYDDQIRKIADSHGIDLKDVYANETQAAVAEAPLEPGEKKENLVTNYLQIPAKSSWQ